MNVCISDFRNLDQPVQLSVKPQASSFRRGCGLHSTVAFDGFPSRTPPALDKTQHTTQKRSRPHTLQLQKISKTITTFHLNTHSFTHTHTQPLIVKPRGSIIASVCSRIHTLACRVRVRYHVVSNTACFIPSNSAVAQSGGEERQNFDKKKWISFRIT